MESEDYRRVTPLVLPATVIGQWPAGGPGSPPANSAQILHQSLVYRSVSAATPTEDSELYHRGEEGVALHNSDWMTHLAAPPDSVHAADYPLVQDRQQDGRYQSLISSEAISGNSLPVAPENPAFYGNRPYSPVSDGLQDVPPPSKNQTVKKAKLCPRAILLTIAIPIIGLVIWVALVVSKHSDALGRQTSSFTVVRKPITSYFPRFFH